MSATRRLKGDQPTERREADVYETPSWISDKGLSTLTLPSEPLILDPGAGSGVWGGSARNLWPGAWIEGVEIRALPPPDNGSYDNWLPDSDFLRVQDDVMGKYDLVMGNPPYSLAEEFIRRAMHLTKDGGFVQFLLRLPFLEGKKRRQGLWRDFPLYQLQICSERPSFTGDHKTDATAYAVFTWKKGHAGVFEGAWL